MKALGAISAQGMQAAVSFVLQILVARLLGIEALGQFAILYGFLVFATGVVTGLVGDSLVVLDRAEAKIRGGLAVMLYSVVIALAVTAAFVAALTGAIDALTAGLFGAAIAAFSVEEIVRRLLMANMAFVKVAIIDFLGFVIALAIILSLMQMLSVGVFLGAIAAGQTVAAVVGWFLLPKQERGNVSLRGADVRTVWRYGRWRSLQQMLRPGMFTGLRLLVLAATTTAAVGLLEAARTYTSPIMLVVGGMSSYLFVRFAQQVKDDNTQMRMALRQADRAVLILIGLAAVMGAVAAVISPWIGPLLFAETLDLMAVIAWTTYGASVALVTPYGSLLAVTNRQVAVFLVRLNDTLLGLICVVIMLWVGVSPSVTPFALAATSVLGGIALRLMTARIARHTPAEG